MCPRIPIVLLLLGLPLAAAPAPTALAPSYATFLGGEHFDDVVNSIATDPAGNTYVAGKRYSATFQQAPSSFANTNCQITCGFVLKFDAGNQLVFSAFVGNLDVRDVAVAPDGGIVLLGRADSLPFDPQPVTPGAFQTTQPGGMARAVVKLKADGTGIEFGTYLGGAYLEREFGLAVDDAGGIYVTGLTTQGDSLLTAAGQSIGSPVAQRAFVAKLSADGSSLAYLALLGGAGITAGLDLAVDDARRAYVAGSVLSGDFPATHGVRHGAEDAFVARLSPDGATWEFATLVGGDGGESGEAVALLPGGRIVLAGSTTSANLATSPGALQSSQGGVRNGLVAVLEADGSIAATTYLGGSYIDSFNDAAVLADGTILLGGGAFSTDMPTTPSGFQSASMLAELEGYVAVVDAGLSSLLYGSYLSGGYTVAAGNPRTLVWAVAAHPDGGGLAGGFSLSRDLPILSNAISPSVSGVADAFFYRFVPTGFLIETPSGLPFGIIGRPYAAQFQSAGGSGIVEWALESGALPAGMTLDPDGHMAGVLAEPPFPVGSMGPYHFTLRATDGSGARTYRDYVFLAARELQFLEPLAAVLPDALLGEQYQRRAIVGGGYGIISAEQTGGVLPPGMNVRLYSAMEVGVEGTPGATGTYAFTFEVRDSVGQVISQSATLRVVDPTPPDPPPAGGGGGGGGAIGPWPLAGLLLLAVARVRRPGRFGPGAGAGAARPAPAR